MKEIVTGLASCQYLLVSPINYTLTNFAAHCDAFSYDAVNRYLRGGRITPRLIWDTVKEQIIPAAEGYLIFDDTVLDKRCSLLFYRAIGISIKLVRFNTIRISHSERIYQGR
jgi:hypothetical protein